MIKKLRMKIILISVLSVVLILLIIMGTINILNYRSTIKNADRVLTMLIENNGTFPMDNKPDDTNSRPEGSPPINTNPPPDDKISSGGDIGNSGFNLRSDDKFKMREHREARYFYVNLDTKGNVTDTDVNQMASVNNETAKKLALKYYKNTDKAHNYKNYRYRSQKKSDGYLIVFLDISTQLQSQKSFLVISLLVSAGGLVVIFVLLIFFSNWVVKPVEESFEKQKRFITDAGHEIKTPLATIKADAAVIEYDLSKDSEGHEWLQDIKVQINRLTELTNDLIYLSKMDESREKLNKYDFVISDTANEVSRSFSSRAKIGDKEYRVNIEKLVTFKGDEKAIYELFSILLDNAVKYSNKGGKIDFSLKRKGKNIIIQVFNTTENISENNIKHLFDRFYRTDESRNSDRGGYGIGLSKAQAIVKAHDGKIVAKTEDGKSLNIKVTL